MFLACLVHPSTPFLVDVPSCPAESFVERIQSCITDAISCGYDGIELDVCKFDAYQFYGIYSCILVSPRICLARHFVQQH